MAVNVAILSNTLRTGGAEVQSIHLADVLSDRHRVFYVVYYGSERDPAMVERINRVDCPVYLLEGGHLKKAWHIFRLFRRYRVTVAFSYLATTNVLNAVIGWLARVPVRIGGIRSSEFTPFKLRIQRFLHNHLLTCTVFNNHAGYHELTKDGFREDKAEVIPNAVTIPEPKPVRNRSENRDLSESRKPDHSSDRPSGATSAGKSDTAAGNASANQPGHAAGKSDHSGGEDGESVVTILSLGRFVPLKGFDTALEVVKILSVRLNETGENSPEETVDSSTGKTGKKRTAGPLFRYVIAGYGELEAFLREETVRRDLQQYVEIVPEPEDPGSLYRMSDIFLSTSRYEGLSNAIMEAISYGLPVVVTDVGDNNRLIRDGISGYLAPVDDAKKMAEALLYLIRDPARRKSMGKKGSDYLQDDYSIRSFQKRYDDLLDRLLTTKAKL